MTLFRGTKKAAGTLGNQCIQDQTFTWSSFTSTAMQIDGINDFVGQHGDRVIWIIQMLPRYLGGDIQAFSEYLEHEVLLAPGMTFEVTAVLDLGNSLTQVQVRQIGHSFYGPRRDIAQASPLRLAGVARHPHGDVPLPELKDIRLRLSGVQRVLKRNSARTTRV